MGLVPYVTASEQSTVIAGQGAELQVGNVFTNNAFGSSELTEFGIKGSLLDDRLYFALSSYEMERTDFNAQSITVNQAVKTDGTEFELRWVVSEKFLMTLGYSNMEALMLATIAAGNEFSFLGQADLPLIDPTLLWGGQVGGLIDVAPSKGVRAGMPETLCRSQQPTTLVMVWRSAVVWLTWIRWPLVNLSPSPCLPIRWLISA